MIVCGFCELFDRQRKCPLPFYTMSTQEMRELRTELDRINQITDLLEQQKEIIALRDVCLHSCVLTKTRPSDPGMDYPAFAWALDLHDNPQIMEHKEQVFSNH